MKLKRLDIKGFKSFANDTSIHFNDEIIGIVGPNGSGKSNIVDAIRWVLGEQKSKELRLEKMVDVIFNGTKSKRKASMAQVSMTFENSKKLIPLDYETVTISRILYDTNDSEYRLNNVPCRLKDIRDLFLDTGIGSNSYAIIELGMVDDILMDKDHARRRMFEQAAGISKYKVRKRETLAKLTSTQTDLDRIEDILFELQSNLKSLERQAKRTKKYYELKEEYKEVSIQKTAISQKQSIAKEAELKSQIAESSEKFNGLNASMHELEAEVEKMKAENLDGEKQLSEKQREFNEIIEQLRKTESQIEIKKQNNSFLKQNFQRVNNNKEEFTKNIHHFQSMIGEMNNNLEELKQKSLPIKEEFNRWQEDFEKIEKERLEIQGENNSHLEELKQLEALRFGLEKELVGIRSNYNNKINNLGINKDEIQELNEKVNLLENQKAEVQENINLVSGQLQDLNIKLENLESEKKHIASLLQSEKENLILANRKLDALNNEYSLLKDMIDNLEGFPESAKFLAKNWDKNKPMLSDIMECEDKYRSAIEAYLEPYLSYFILDNVDEARSSIELLRKAQKGKSQFFILSSFDNYNINVINLSQYGKSAVNVVKTEAKYESLVYHLLSKVVIVEDDQLLNEVLPDDELIYLSTSGFANRAKHVISGGSVGLFDGKRIGRQKEIKKLKSRITETESDIELINSKISNFSDKLSTLVLEEIISEIKSKNSLLSQLEIRKVEFDTRIQNHQNNIESLTNKILVVEKSISDDLIKIEETEKEVAELVKKVELKSELVADQSGKMESLSKNYTYINSQFTEAQLNWVKHQNQLESLEKDTRFREQQVSEITIKLKEAEEELVRINEQSVENESSIKILNQQLLEESQIRDSKKLQLNETEQLFFSSRAVIREKEEALKQLNKSIQNQQFIINELKDKLTGIEFELRSAIERLKIEFNIDIKSLDVEINEDPEWIEELEGQYEKIKKRLENYGEINPMAVEAYDEMMVRFETMESQRNDILEARDSLHKTISEIDSEATKMFLDSFYKAKDNFKEVFRSLFSSEDDCDLILFNTENPLDSDIEIVAKPKGKRPKVLSQLSGGEKTLTATALLFSLYLLKPAPFCIFDEVDAPLDDINIQKFSRLIRRFSDASQFIIITHNKSTMAAMDTLYGVYMQEQGVSGITQVDFREYEHNELFKTVSLQ